MARERYTFEGLEPIEKHLKRRAADVAYLVLWDRTDRTQDDTVGRFEFSLGDALPYLEDDEDLLDEAIEGEDDEMPWARGARVAVGTPVLYYDVDADGRWSQADTLAGGSGGLGVVHVEDPVPTDLAVQPGYQRASSDSPLCGATTGSPLAPPATASTPLFVQGPWNVFQDWDCDGELHEWQHLCPPPGDLEAFCDPEFAGAYPGLLGWCVDQVC